MKLKKSCIRIFFISVILVLMFSILLYAQVPDRLVKAREEIEKIYTEMKSKVEAGSPEEKALERIENQLKKIDERIEVKDYRSAFRLLKRVKTELERLLFKIEPEKVLTQRIEKIENLIALAEEKVAGNEEAETYLLKAKEELEKAKNEVQVKNYRKAMAILNGVQKAITRAIKTAEGENCEITAERVEKIKKFLQDALPRIDGLLDQYKTKVTDNEKAQKIYDRLVKERELLSRALENENYFVAYNILNRIKNELRLINFTLDPEKFLRAEFKRIRKRYGNLAEKIKGEGNNVNKKKYRMGLKLMKEAKTY
ncbi:hypothetical protein DRQ09_04910, partial [candidate division KSB1 bacterium]